MEFDGKSVFRHPHACDHLTHRAAFGNSPEQALEHLRRQNVLGVSLKKLEMWDGEKWISVNDAPY